MCISPGATKAWDMAAEEAAIAGCPKVEKEHLMIGILSLEKQMGLSELDSYNRSIRYEYDAIENILYGAAEGVEVTMAGLRRKIRQKIKKGSLGPDQTIHRSDACKKLFTRALALSTLKHKVSCVHLLVAILEDPGPAIEDALDEESIRAEDMMEPALAWITLIEYDTGQGPVQDVPGPVVKRYIGPVPVERSHPVEKSYLDTYGRDLTREALEGRIAPFAGRRQELLQVVRIFGRCTKNNPVLVGEAGVGKTAIVEALAMRTARSKDPDMLGGKRIIELNMASMLANTRYRGDFEERVTKIIEEANARPEIILFIDEIHTIVGAGRSDGSGMDAASILKPALARGLRCIGATTLAEYQRHIESDPALERRFEKVTVNEPGRDEALLMLQALRPKLEEYHGVRILDSALDAAIDLSIRFDASHQLPDKAIDLLDRACARSRIPSLSWSGNGTEDGSLDDKAIAIALSEKSKIPLEIITSREGTPRDRLLELEPYLKEKLIGQDDAIGRTCQRLLIAYSGLSRRSGPIAIFLFAGPSGVGKTEMARSLSEFLFGSASAMIRFDMSEFQEEHSAAKLIGSPPGYVGHDEEGQLTGKLRARPHSIVLFDEVEKAHPKVLDLFIQLFDEGRITDSKGRTADARNAIFIMTSNLRLQGLDYRAVESGALKDMIRGRPRKPAAPEENSPLKPELLNRIDDQVFFHTLDMHDVRLILKRLLAEVLRDLERQQGIMLICTEEVESFLARMGYSPEYGVRELRRAVENFIRAPLSKLILTGEIKKYPRWLAIYENGRILIVPDIIPHER